MNRQEFLGLRFDYVTMEEALSLVACSRRDGPFRYIVTPNVDHIVRLHASSDAETHAAYADADLCLCDSRIVAELGWLSGLPLQLVTGSDLIARLIPARIAPNDRINLIGGSATTYARLCQLTPAAKIRHLEPPMGMLRNPHAMAEAVQFILDNPADLTLLAVGSPQQEIIAHRAAGSGRASGIALCIGASINFITGEKRRAPRIMQRLGLEWLFRLLSEPRRLWRRYLLSSPLIFGIAVRWHRDRKRRS